MTAIQEALRQYDPQNFRDRLEKGQRERAELLEKFPRSRWPKMSLTDYALGQDINPDNLSRWLERESLNLGSIRGGSATKFLIYKKRDEPGWYYDARFTDENEAWLAVRADFIRMFELAEAGEWDTIDDLEVIRGARVVKSKLLHLYFPEEILPVYSVEHMRAFLDRLGVETTSADQWQPVRLNRLLLQTLRTYPETRDWTTNELERFLYSRFDPREEKRAPRIIKIAPGEQGSLWQECLEQGYIRVGWDEIGDLTEYEDEVQFRAAFAEKYRYNDNESAIRKKATELWTLNNLEPGDIIIANRGVSAVLGIGTVVEPGYQWLADANEYRQAVTVKWDTRHARDMALPQSWRFATVAPVTGELYQQIINATGEESASIPTSPVFGIIADALERKGQVILHGPPGTGKTYHARHFADWWLARYNGNKPDDLTAQTSTRRVWWVVANPKHWHWDELFPDGREDFNFGRIGRNYPQVQSGDLVIGYLAAPDKRIVALAKVVEGLHGTGDDRCITLAPVYRIKNGPEYAQLIADPNLNQSEPLQNRCQGTLFKLEAEEANYLLNLLAENDPEIEQYISQAGTVANAAAQLTMVTFHPSYSYEDFIEGFRPQQSGQGLSLRLTDGLFKAICLTARANPDRRYLILIDEINRANLAKVFGEIITLLERDKRGWSIILPQSKEEFVVPENVYLLGTMNTSDRSIRLMDAALRRRFGFIELMPESELLRGATIEDSLKLEDFLTILNNRISRQQGRDKQIGHAFFLEKGQPISDTSEFGRRFRQEVLPLLQEYCYDDYEELAGYIGPLVDLENMALRSEILKDDQRLVAALTAFTNNAFGSTQ